MPDGDWIADDREGLSFADATSAVFAYRIPWDKVDVATFSWQKVLGGEGAHGVLILGPRAVERLEGFTPDRPLPKLFRLTKNGQAHRRHFHAARPSTRRRCCASRTRFSRSNGRRSIGGLEGHDRRSEANAAALDRIVATRDWLGHLAQRSGKPVEHQRLPRRSVGAGWDEIKAMAKLLEAGRRGVRHRRLSRRPARPSHLVRCDGRHRRHRSARAMARLGMGAECNERPSSRVLIADKMDPRAAAMFRERGIHVDEKPGLIARRAGRDHRRL